MKRLSFIFIFLFSLNIFSSDVDWKSFKGEYEATQGVSRQDLINIYQQAWEILFDLKVEPTYNPTITELHFEENANEVHVTFKAIERFRPEYKCRFTYDTLKKKTLEKSIDCF